MGFHNDLFVDRCVDGHQERQTFITTNTAAMHEPHHGYVGPEGKFFIDNLLVRIHFMIVMTRWTDLTPWEF